MNKTSTVDVLNTLIESHNERIQGYETALDAIEDVELKSLFIKLSQTGWKCKSELVDEVYKLGGTPTKGLKTTSRFIKIWVDVKSALTGNDQMAILTLCKYGEGIAIDTYEKALTNELDNAAIELKAMLHEHLKLIRANHYTIKGLLSKLYIIETN
jgi:uncharacterized protein (TIGR02284 family)